MVEPEIIIELKNGNDRAFKKVVDEFQKYVLNTCYRFVNVKEIAEDLTQDVFIEVYRSIKNFRGESKLSTWIYRIAVTKSLDYLKAQKRKKRFAYLKSIFGDEELEEQLPMNDVTNPDTILENKNRIEILLNALSTLPESQRVAFTLSKYDELSYKEIAEILGTTIPSVESLIHRAKKNLKKKLYTYYKKNL